MLSVHVKLELHHANKQLDTEVLYEISIHVSALDNHFSIAIHML